MIEIKLEKEYKLNGYILLEGFPSVGLVGPMVNSYIVEKLKMEYIGHIESDAFPPIATIHDAVPLFPVRLYKDDKFKIIAIVAEFTVPPNIIYQLSYELLNFVRKYGISQVVSIGGIIADKPSDKVFAIASSQDLIAKAASAGISTISEGVIAGVSAILLSNAPEYNIPIIDILVQVNPSVMDPKYAERIIANLEKLIKIEIDLSELEKESKMIQAKTKEILKKAKESHESYNNAIDATGPSAYV
ncbi:MAG: PAC2 family protein [Candidatus Micrarchaeaceae archaeon]